MRVAATAAFLAAFACAACGGGKHPIEQPDGGSGGAGGSTTESSTSTGQPAVCGDGKREGIEECDGLDLGGNTCKTLGQDFNAGTLQCSSKCTLDTSGCKTIELCTDGSDNDKNNLADCKDPACAAACADSCTTAAITVLAPPITFVADSSGHAAKLKPSCSSVDSGPELVFQVTYTDQGAGIVEAKLISDPDMSLSARKTCDIASSEIACSNRTLGPQATERLRAPIATGESLYLVADGVSSTDQGSFVLDVQMRPVICGDYATDPPEQCDDGNTDPGDGCDASCKVEASETEPNDTVAQANTYKSPWFGRIASASDVDVVAVNVTQAPAAITVEVKDFDHRSCNLYWLDSVVEVYAPDGVTLLGLDDDSGSGGCSKLTVAAKTPGKYYVRVTPSGVALDPVFSYKLDVSMVPTVCGDGIMQAGEQCDDANTTAGDGCSPTCQLESTEVEPNDSAAQANAYKSPWYGKISPVGDIDVVAFKMPAGATQLAAQIGDNGDGDCANLVIISELSLLAPDGTTVIAKDMGTGAGYCAYLDATGLTPGSTYYLRVNASFLDPSSTFTYVLDVATQ
jgi:cysteine-rich repeat protein